jgi:Zn-dependent M28 family amino/carboxypeptidase
MRSPHTGASNAAGIPAMALAVPDAEQLDRLAALGGPVRVRIVSTPTIRSGATADTVIGEIPGREKPDEIVLIGGHLDSWDLGTGAIDDGAGVAITTAAAKLIADMPQRPRRTLRVALFGAEELNFSNAAYAKAHPAEEQARHVIGSECDFGAEPPYRIALPAGAAASAFGRALSEAEAPLSIYIDRGPARDGGSDLEYLVGVPLAELGQDGSHYFDYHHAPDDTLDKTDPHRMDQAVAAWVAFAYLAADTDVDFRAIAAAAPPPSPGRRP